MIQLAQGTNEGASQKVVNIFRGEARPGKIDEILELFRQSTEDTRSELGTEIRAVHLEPPNVVWVYAMFSNADARAAHRNLNHHDRLAKLKPLFVELLKPYEVVPVAAVGADLE